MIQNKKKGNDNSTVYLYIGSIIKHWDSFSENNFQFINKDKKLDALEKKDRSSCGCGEERSSLWYIIISLCIDYNNTV